MRYTRFRRIWLGFCLLFVFAGSVAAENWPCWRGPRGDGTSQEQNLPTQWSGPTESDPQGRNLVWKTPLPGLGHASPIVWGDRIFVVTATQEPPERVLLCLDRETGRLLWRRVVVTSPLEGKHRLNSHASSTPATDGRQVYVSFLDRDAMLVAAYDFEGRRQWLVRPGAFSSVHGYCSSATLFEDLVILNGDHDGDGYLVALDRRTGKTVWKTPRPNNTRSYCAPIIRRIDGRTQMILSGSLCVASYDPSDGSRHWILDGPTEQFVASPVYNGKLLFLTAGYPEFHILAIRPDGHGKLGESAIVWRTTKGCAYVPSPILAGGGKYFLIISDNGIASCFEAATGKRYWQKRIGPHYSASLFEAGGLVYFLSDRGVTTVIRPGPQFDPIAENPLCEDCYASPATSAGHLFLRAEKHLYCIGPGWR